MIEKCFVGFLTLHLWTTLLVDQPLPENLQNVEDGSNHASQIFKGNDDMRTYFSNELVRTTEWNLEHSNDMDFSKSRNVKDYSNEFAAHNFKLWDIQNKQEAICRLNLKDKIGKTSEISGRADYLITASTITRAELLISPLCVIEVQSNDDQTSCELQLLTYMLLLLNTKGLHKLLGFLVLNDGRCRTFRASRSMEENVLYEQNDYCHVSQILDILLSLMEWLKTIEYIL